VEVEDREGEARFGIAAIVGFDFERALEGGLDGQHGRGFAGRTGNADDIQFSALELLKKFNFVELDNGDYSNVTKKDKSDFLIHSVF